MLAFLILTQVFLGGAGLALSALGDDIRAGAVRLLAGTGALAALGLFLVRDSDATWASLSMEPDRAAVAAIAILCSWLLVFATDEGRGRWETVALTGAGSAGLVSFSLAQWVAPAVLAYGCLSAATLVAALHSGRRLAALLLAVSDLLVIGALIGWAWGEETWALHRVLEDYHSYLLVGALVLRIGVLPRLGVWEMGAGGQPALVPLVVGSGFALVPLVSGGDEIWIALPLLLVALAIAAWSIAFRPRASLAGAWMVSAMLALPWIAPAALGRAAASAVLASSGVLLWRWSGGRAGAERGLLLAGVPLTAGFGAIVAAAAASFQRAVDAETVLASAPWSAFAALLPVALAAGITLGASLGRRVEPETFSAPAVVVTWILAGIALVLGLSPGSALDFEGAGDRTLLFALAAFGGAIGARWLPRTPPVTEPAAAPPSDEVTWFPPRRLHLDWVAASLVVLALGAALAFTYTGLRIGFL